MTVGSSRVAKFMKPSRVGDRDLVRMALNADDESDAYWDAIRELQKRGTREVFEVASEQSIGRQCVS